MSVSILPPSQIVRVYPLIAPFLAEFGHPESFNPEAFGQFWATLYGADMGRILIAEHAGEVIGALGYSWHQDCYTGAKVIHEQFLWVFPEHRASGVGRELIEEFERRGKKLGVGWAFLCNLVGLAGEKMDAFYVRNGYKCMERVYWKDMKEKKSEGTSGAGSYK
jgi:GNAT superfamily N-acetyltransferase